MSNNYRLTTIAGFTILELMIVLIITALVVITGYPCWQAWLSHHQAKLAVDRIQQIISYARICAMSGVEEVRIAAICNNSSLSEDWNQLVTVRTASGQLVRSFPKLIANGRLRWRGSLDCQTIVFKTDGSCSCQGSFDYYADDSGWAERSNGWHVTLLMSGQTYQTNQIERTR